MPENEKEEYSRVTLDTVADGALPELFERELDQVLENIADPNTPAEAIREITIKIKIRPDANRAGADYLVETSNKLAKVVGVKNRIYLGPSKRTNRVTAYVTNMKQANLFADKNTPVIRVVGEE